MTTNLDHMLTGVAAWAFVEANNYLIERALTVNDATEMKSMRRLLREVSAREKRVDNGYGVGAGEPDDANGTLTGRSGEGNDSILHVQHVANVNYCGEVQRVWLWMRV